MGDKSKIEWTDATWNPIVGCSIVSPGCTNCYAMKIAPRTDELSIGAPWVGNAGRLTKSSNAGPVWTGAIRFVERRLTEPLRWRKPRMIFVNSMGDLFHESIPDEWIDKVFAVMALCPQHTFQVLTKRSERMRDYFTKRQFRDAHPLEVRHDAIDAAMNDIAPAHWCKRELEDYSPEGLPLPNVWLGVSAERQKEADERIEHLLQTPAAVRFVSCEPLLGPIDLTEHCNGHYFFDSLRGTRWHDDPDVSRPAEKYAPGLDWVIPGGESGPNAREHDIAWSRSLIAQCKRAGVAVFEKQLGSRPIGPHPNGVNASSYRLKDRKGGDWSEWPDDLRVREFPTTPSQQRSAA